MVPTVRKMKSGVYLGRLLQWFSPFSLHRAKCRGKDATAGHELPDLANYYNYVWSLYCSVTQFEKNTWFYSEGPEKAPRAIFGGFADQIWGLAGHFSPSYGRKLRTIHFLQGYRYSVVYSLWPPTRGRHSLIHISTRCKPIIVHHGL